MNYILTLKVPRSKVPIIKLFRMMLRHCTSPWGLKEAKDYVEANFVFIPGMAPEVEFDLTINAKQLGHVLAYLWKEAELNKIVSIHALEWRQCEHDFTHL